MKRFLLPVFFTLGVIYPQESGEYVTEHGWGTMMIRATKTGAKSFKLNAVGANFHTCGLEGEIHNGEAKLESESPEKPCVVTFSKAKGGIEVKNSNNTCRYYCGARAHFEGLYLKPAKGCSPGEISKARTAFKRHYDKKQYTEAQILLEPVLRNCEKVLWWIDSGWIRNDLAITKFHLGNKAGCRRVLADLADDAAKTDEELQGNYPPSDWDAYSKVINAARTNLKLCR